MFNFGHTGLWGLCQHSNIIFFTDVCVGRFLNRWHHYFSWCSYKMFVIISLGGCWIVQFYSDWNTQHSMVGYNLPGLIMLCCDILRTPELIIKLLSCRLA